MKKLLPYLIFLLPFITNGQQTHIKLDTNTILIGEQVGVFVGIIYTISEGEEPLIQLPVIGDQLTDELEVVKHGDYQTVPIDEDDPTHLVHGFILTVTSFEVGIHSLPSFTFVFNGDTIQTDALIEDSHSITVKDIAPVAEDQLADIKAPLTDPMTVWEWINHHWLFFFLPLIAVLVIVLVLFFFLSKKSKKAVVPVKPKEPAHVVALQKLEKINAAGLWQEGQFKEYHSQLSVVIREYLEKRYQIHALEQTSDEIFTALRFKNLTEVNKERLKQLLLLADLVKFAKEIPIGDENEESMQLALSFVEETKLVEQEVNNNDGDSN